MSKSSVCGKTPEDTKFNAAILSETTMPIINDSENEPPLVYSVFSSFLQMKTVMEYLKRKSLQTMEHNEKPSPKHTLAALSFLGLLFCSATA